MTRGVAGVHGQQLAATTEVVRSEELPGFTVAKLENLSISRTGGALEQPLCQRLLQLVAGESDIDGISAPEMLRQARQQLIPGPSLPWSAFVSRKLSTVRGSQYAVVWRG